MVLSVPIYNQANKIQQFKNSKKVKKNKYGIEILYIS